MRLLVWTLYTVFLMVSVAAAGPVPVDQATSIMVSIIMLLIYFLPALVAAGRKHHSANAILLLDLLLGWTFLGWVAALVWSATMVHRGAEGFTGRGGMKCPECAETIQAEALVCRYCGHRFED